MFEGKKWLIDVSQQSLCKIDLLGLIYRFGMSPFYAFFLPLISWKRNQMSNRNKSLQSWLNWKCGWVWLTWPPPTLLWLNVVLLFLIFQVIFKCDATKKNKNRKDIIDRLNQIQNISLLTERTGGSFLFSSRLCHCPSVLSHLKVRGNLTRSTISTQALLWASVALFK